MSTTARSLADRLLAGIGWGIVALVSVPTTMLWLLLVWSWWVDRRDLTISAGSVIAMAAFVLSVPVLFMSILRWRAWRSPNAMAIFTVAMFVYGLCLLSWVSVLAMFG